ncbi:MAG: Unknown protein [uncultured Aureispira sp.]|uniref:Uncharacterized protein n=1 Tax=uncultured Aureispira sp. TaxID=1331704 RepID=A0A6S6T305_9BACT|nr:MAG: Unknown protein [uncultured Aureispira sp.]
MKRLNLISILIFSSVLMLSLASCENKKKTESKDADSQKEVSTEKGERKIIFENDYAQVISIKLDVGEFISPPGGKGKDRVIYSLSDYTLDRDKGDGEMESKTWKENEVHFHEAGNHYVKNTGNTTAEWLVFVKKTDDLPECSENKLDNDVHSITPDFSQKLFENDDFKVTKVILTEGKSIPMHSGINRIIYSLNDYQISYESDKEETVEKTFQKDDIHWHEACKHAMQNIGNSEAKFLVVSFKKK